MKKLMKKMLLVVILITLFSCQNNSKTDVLKLKNGITYFKDDETNLCFATINSSTYGGYEIVSITCVPCDSIKKLIK